MGNGSKPVMQMVCGKTRPAGKVSWLVPYGAVFQPNSHYIWENFT